MTIKHATTKAPGDELHAVADWNANHTGTAEPDAHGLANATKHTSAATPGKILKADANGLPIDATNTENANTTNNGLLLQATAPGANELNVVGIASGETVYANKDLFNTTNPAALGSVSSGTGIQASRSDHIHPNPKIDDLAAADNNTDLNVSATAHGLCPIFPNNTTTFLRGDGTYAAPAGGSALQIATVVGASSGNFSTTSTSYVDVTNATRTITTHTDGVQLMWFSASGQSSSTSGRVILCFDCDGTDSLNFYHGAPIAAENWLVTAHYTKTGLAAASKVFKVQMKVESGTGGILNSSSNEWSFTIMEVY